MDQSQHVEPSFVGRPLFWVGPLLVGCSFAMGFGIADRVVSLHSDQNPVPTQRFAPSPFPGESLQALRSLHRDDANLQEDLAALNLTSPELGHVVNPPTAIGTEKNLALQRPPTEDRAWTAPALSDPDADLDPSVVSTESIQQMESEQAPSSVLFSAPPEAVPPVDASLLITEPQHPGFVAENDARLLMPMQPLMPPSKP